MKITCNSCGSKYNIADAKVQGKKVKVRCKGCKESILVDGTKIGKKGVAPATDKPAASKNTTVSTPLKSASLASSAAASRPPSAASRPPTAPVSSRPPSAPVSSRPPSAPVSSRPPSAPVSSRPPSAPVSSRPPSAPTKDPSPAPIKASSTKKSLWSVNITDDDSRDMTLIELVKAWKDGVVKEDAYVWKDGMDDWKPILEVGELKLKLGAPPQKKDQVVSSAPVSPAAQGNKMDDLFGSADLAGSEPSEMESPSPFDGDGEKPTGARNDSSVLFSLDSLKGAGDLKKTAQKTTADDLFGSLGASGPSLGGNTDLLTAPAKEPPLAPAGARVQSPTGTQGKGKGGLIAAILGAAIIVGGAVMFMSGGSAKAPADTSARDAKVAAAEAKAAEAEKKAKAAEAKAAEAAKKADADIKKARDEAKAKGEDPQEVAAKKKAELETAEKEKTAQAASAKSGTKSADKNSGSKSATKSTKKKSSSGGAKFDAGAARAALSAAAANAAGCKKPGGPTGSGKVQITFSTSGRVTSSRIVAGPFGGTAVGGCVVSTFRRTRIPKFSGSPKTVRKSFRIR